MRAIPLLLLALSCSSSPLTSEPREDAAEGEPANRAEADAPTTHDCRECLAESCVSSYRRCLPKDPNGCANLSVCVKSCAAASCAHDCGGYWAVSPAAREYYACLSDQCAGCFSED